MINLKTFFINHFDTKAISDDTMKELTQKHLVSMSENNPGNIYDTLITDTTQVYTNYFGAMTDEATKIAIKEGKTVTMNVKLTEFKDFVSQQEGLIRSKWGVKSAEYQEFYPQGITEYLQATLASIEQIMVRYINAATTYQLDLGAPFVTDVTTLSDEFIAARQSQISLMAIVEGKKSETSVKRDVVEIQLMKNLLIIASNNVGDETKVEDYFDQSLIRPQKERTYSGEVLQGETANVVERSFGEHDEIKCSHTGTDVWKVCLAPTAGDACANGIIVNPDEEITVTASELGDYENNHFLNITNTGASDGSYSVVVEL